MIVTSPIFCGFIVPSASIIAIELSLEVHDTFLFVAVDGDISIFGLTVSLGSKYISFWTITTPVTGIVTLTSQVAVLEPSFVVTVMWAVPASLAVTFPSWFTVATSGLSEAHVTSWFVELLGYIS